MVVARTSKATNCIAQYQATPSSSMALSVHTYAIRRAGAICVLFAADHISDTRRNRGPVPTLFPCYLSLDHGASSTSLLAISAFCAKEALPLRLCSSCKNQCIPCVRVQWLASDPAAALLPRCSLFRDTLQIWRLASDLLLQLTLALVRATIGSAQNHCSSRIRYRPGSSTVVDTAGACPRRDSAWSKENESMPARYGRM